jgi:hypothetical protein
MMLLVVIGAVDQDVEYHATKKLACVALVDAVLRDADAAQKNRC